MKSLDPKPGKEAMVPPLPAVVRPVSNLSPRHKGWKGRALLKPGTILLADHEKKALTEIGWKEGQAIPGNLGELLRRAKDKVAHEIQTTQAGHALPDRKLPDSFKPDIPPEIDINDLEGSKRDDIEAYLRDFQTKAADIERAANNPTQLTPGVQEALQAMGHQAGVEVTDSRDDLPPNPYADLQQRIDEAEGKKPSDKEGELVEDEEDIAEEIHKDNIPYADKVAFLVAIDGGQPFKKAYTFFGGRVEIVFRQLTTERGEWVLNTIPRLVREGVIENGMQERAGWLYRMILALDYVRVASASLAAHNLVDNMLTASFSNFQPVYNEVRMQTVFEKETIWKAAQNAYGQFEGTLALLEQRATDSDFWAAIEG